MAALKSAVAKRSDAIARCMGENSIAKEHYKAVMRCTFDAEGKPVQCAPAGKHSLNKQQLGCLNGALAKLKLDPQAGEVAKCEAQIELEFFQPPYHRRNRDDLLKF